MRDALPSLPRPKECAIVNLDSGNGEGSHWVAYKKVNDLVTYFDSFGNLPPPVELQKYLKGCSIKYNYESYQTFGTNWCGHLCTLFLLDILKIKKYVRNHHASWKVH